jgi:hexosaminidase
MEKKPTDKLSIFTGTPAYAYRGVMLDVARHFFPIAEVKHLLDIMSRMGLNVFHWHLSDDQGFRVALRDYPELESVSSRREYSQQGGYNKSTGNDKTPYSGCYSEDEIREVVAYAAGLDIEIIPELDMPGHLSAVIAAYPWLSCSGRKIKVPGKFGILKNVLCMGNDDALAFMEGIVHALVDLFGARRFHIGFDEVVLDHMRNCPKCNRKIVALGLKNGEQLKAWTKGYFRDSLKARGVETIAYNDGMDAADTDAICYHWFTYGSHNQKTAKWINEGQRVIMASLPYMYLDYPYVWTPLRKTYGYNPILRGVQRTDCILGVEAPLWTEHVPDHGKLAFNTYYRMFAIAYIGHFGNDRPPYAEFIKTLREHEEELFGERLNIPDNVINPPLATRAKLAELCKKKDMNAEYKAYMGDK